MLERMFAKKHTFFMGLCATLLMLMFVGCAYNNEAVSVISGETSNVAQSVEPLLTREKYNCNLRYPDQDKVVQMAEDMLQGKLYVLDTEQPLPYESVESLDWNVQYTTQPNTFQLYLQCLNPTMYLTRAYEVSGKIEYLQLAEELILSWNDFRQTPQAEGNSFVWYDHGTALRANNLIYYALVARESENLSAETAELIESMLREHEEFLADDANYTKNHNHGIFQDQSLIYIAYYLDDENSEEYLNIAKERLAGQEDFAFNSEMVHVENSPGYQAGVMDLFWVVADFLEQYGDEYGQHIHEDLVQAARFMSYIVKPNGIVAEIGDTNSAAKTNKADSVEDISAEQQETMTTDLETLQDLYFGSTELQYAQTMGQYGQKPEETAAFYPQSGYYISHNSWEKENYSQSTWQMFKSGYESKTHKHADDNSFMLYSKGYDIFVDPGWYNYMTGDPYRDYFVSSSAHNTVVVDGKSYSATVENSWKTGIYDWEDTADWDYVLGFNNQYTGVQFDRHFYNLGDSIILYDNIVSEDTHTYTQLLHASEEMELVEEGQQEVLFRLADTGYYVRVKQLIPCGSNRVTYGGEDGAFSYISRSMAQLDEIYTLEYSVTGSNVDLVTLITIEDEQGQVQDLEDIAYHSDQMAFEVTKDSGETFQIQLKARERLDWTDVETQQLSGDTFRFTNNNEAEDSEESLQYAWYVVEKDSAKVVEKTEWSTENVFEYTFSEPKEYLIKAYTRSANQRATGSAIIARITYDQDSGKYGVVTEQEEALNLVYNGQSLENLGDNTYRFTVDYDYAWNSEIKWYIYKNGGYYTVQRSENEKTLTYQFTEPGDYTVMYYLTTPNGDNEFWNFERITIE